MLKPLIALALVMTLPLTAVPAEGPELAAWEDTIHGLFGEAGIEMVECDPAIRERLVKADTDIAICGDSGLAFQAFQQIWRMGMTSLNKQGSEIETLTEWELEEGIYTRAYQAATQRFGLIFTDGHVIVFKTAGNAQEMPPRQHEEEEDLGGPYKVGTEGLSNPVMLSNIPPVYPDIASRAGIQARVVLKCIVKRDGSVVKVRTISCTSPDLGFEEAAETAMRQWKYKPGEINGQPVDVFFEVTVEFSIN